MWGFGGSYDFKEITLDANGPLNASGTLLGRLPVVYRDQDLFGPAPHLSGAVADMEAR